MSNFRKYLIALLLLLTALPAWSAEFFENLDVDITVNKDGSMLIEQSIAVHHEGIYIRRGITETFPQNKGERYKILSVMRNGNPEPWFLDHSPNGELRLNTGDDSLLPSPATSVFKISYLMYDSLRSVFRKPHNELYLNLNGPSPFPIHHITANVYYPQNTKIISQYGYQTNKSNRAYNPGETFEFENIPPYEETTIAQIFEKGTVNVPLPRFWRWLINSLIATLLYYILAWYFFGKDPSPRAIVPDWEAPKNLSALECAYIANNGKAPQNSFFLHILWLIYQKAISVREIQKNNSKKPTVFEVKILENANKSHPETHLFTSRFTDSLTIYDREPDSSIAAYAIELDHKVTSRLEGLYYRKRNILTFLGALFVPITWIMIYPETFGLIIVLTTITSIIATSRFSLVSIIACASLLPFIQATGLLHSSLALVLIPYLALILIFKYLMFQPTIPGQRQKEKIEGMKMFLKTINGSDISIKQPIKNKNGIDLSMEKRLTPQEMEALFTYSVALVLEKAWEQKFKNMFGV
ncbi:MAG: DUF2207 domain-containing protein [Alphaproteobacteria bacterium]|nr:DUF2207 domain-containing protein [Alphaproteobacteria bacterium]